MWLIWLHYLFLRLLMGAVENKPAAAVSQLVNTTGVDLILSDLLDSKSGRFEHLTSVCSVYLFFSWCLLVWTKIPISVLPAVSQVSEDFNWISAGVQRIQDMDTLHSQQRSLGWGLGATQRDQLSRQAGTPALIRLYQLLLFTMPGTPVFTYGDEIGLEAQPVSNKMNQMFKDFHNLTAVTDICLFLLIRILNLLRWFGI